jgi:hypothetical protein
MRRVSSEYQLDPLRQPHRQRAQRFRITEGDDVLADTIVQWSRAHASSKSD